MTNLPRVQSEDIEQEAALLILQGKTPSRTLIYKRLSRGDAIFDEIPQGSTLLFSDNPVPDENVTRQLVEWALEQEERTQQLIFDFLDDPSDEALPGLLSQLDKQGVQLYSREIKREKSLTQVILDEITKAPRTIEELYELGRQVHVSRRPEAAVRQVLRRLTEQRILSLEKGLYTKVEL